MHRQVNIEEVVLSLLRAGKLDDADKVSRSVARQVFMDLVSKLSEDELYNVIDEVTGGLAYTTRPWDVSRMSYSGSIIAWADAVRPGDKVLEVGTGIGRTCYTIVGFTEVSLYLTIDVNPVILAIALYRNPVPEYKEALHSCEVRVVLADAVRALRELARYAPFDHIVHDGGPNPRRNPRLFTRPFLRLLTSLLRPGGRMSVFVGKDRRWQDAVYESLSSLGVEVVETPSLLFSTARVIHGVRKG